MMKIIKNKTRVRVVQDTTGEIPKSLLHRNGIVLRRAKGDDCHSGSGELSKAYMVKMDVRKEPFCFFDDELKVIGDE